MKKGGASTRERRKKEAEILEAGAIDKLTYALLCETIKTIGQADQIVDEYLKGHFAPLTNSRKVKILKNFVTLQQIPTQQRDPILKYAWSRLLSEGINLLMPNQNQADKRASKFKNGVQMFLESEPKNPRKHTDYLEFCRNQHLPLDQRASERNFRYLLRQLLLSNVKGKK